MAVFIEKHPATSSNSYRLQYCSNLAQMLTGHSLCNGILNLNFLVTMATRGYLKIAKHHYFALIFPSKLISKCCELAID
jgi:hypothetical protein